METRFNPFTGNLDLVGLINSPDFFNVKDPIYGAKGDGVTDDLAAIQSAVDDAETIGGIVFFPPGTFAISAAIQWPPNMTNHLVLKGSGRYTTIIKLSATGYAFVDYQTGYVIDDSFQNLAIEDMTIDKNSMTTGDIILEAENSQDRPVHIRHVRIVRVDTINATMTFNTWSVNIGIFVPSGGTIGTVYQIKDIYIEDCFWGRVGSGGGSGIVLYGFVPSSDPVYKTSAGGRVASGFYNSDWIAEVFIDDIVMKKVTWDSGYRSGFPITASAGIQIAENGFCGRIRLEDCHMFGSADVGFEIDSVLDLVVTNCTATDCKNEGFFYSPLGGRGNSTYGYLKDGIHKYINCKVYYTAAGDLTTNTGDGFMFTNAQGINEGPELIFENCETINLSTVFSICPQFAFFGAFKNIAMKSCGSSMTQLAHDGGATAFAGTRACCSFNNFGGRTTVIIDGFNLSVAGTISGVAGYGVRQPVITLQGGTDVSYSIKNITTNLNIRLGGTGPATYESRLVDIGNTLQVATSSVAFITEAFANADPYKNTGEFVLISAVSQIDCAYRTQIDGAQSSTSGTLTVDSTSDFPSAGTLRIFAGSTLNNIAYTGKTGTTFTGCTGGTAGTFADNIGVALYTNNITGNPTGTPTTETVWRWICHNGTGSSFYDNEISKEIDFGLQFGHTPQVSLNDYKFGLRKTLDIAATSFIEAYVLADAAGANQKLFIDKVTGATAGSGGSRTNLAASANVATQMVTGSTYVLRMKTEGDVIVAEHHTSTPSQYKTAADTTLSYTLTGADIDAWGHRALGWLEIAWTPIDVTANLDNAKFWRSSVFRDILVESVVPEISEIRIDSTGAVGGIARGVCFEGLFTTNATTVSPCRIENAKIKIRGNSFTGLFPAATVQEIRLTDATLKQTSVITKLNGYITPPAVAAITVGTSVYTYTNADAYSEMINIYAGTVSDISISTDSGTTFTTIAAASPATVVLNPNDQLKITYTVKPTAIKTPLEP